MKRKTLVSILLILTFSFPNLSRSNDEPEDTYAADFLKRKHEERKETVLQQQSLRSTDLTSLSVSPQVWRVWHLADQNFQSALADSGCKDPKALEFLNKLNTRYKSILAQGAGKMIDLRAFSVQREVDQPLALRPEYLNNDYYNLTLGLKVAGCASAFAGISGAAAGEAAASGGVAVSTTSVTFAGLGAVGAVSSAALLGGIAIGKATVSSYAEELTSHWVTAERARLQNLLSDPSFERVAVSESIHSILALPDPMQRLESFEKLFVNGSKKIRSARMATARAENEVHKRKSESIADFTEGEADAALELSASANLKQAILEKKWLEVLTPAVLLSCSQSGARFHLFAVPDSAINSDQKFPVHAPAVDGQKEKFSGAQSGR